MNQEKIKRFFKNVYPYVVVVILVILIRSFLITPAVVDGDSMNPTLEDHNIVILNKLDYKMNDIKRFDIVVINWKGQKLIKRVIGLPSEHIEYKNDSLFIDGFKISENFKHKSTDDFKLESIGYKDIPGDKYFVVGDNRSDSDDSRFNVGLVDKKDILGSASIRIFPITKLGKIK